MKVYHFWRLLDPSSLKDQKSNPEPVYRPNPQSVPACRQFNIKKVKKRRTGFAAASSEAASSSGVPYLLLAKPVCLFPWAGIVQPGNWCTGEVEPGSTGSTTCVVPGGTGTTGILLPGRTGGWVFPIFLQHTREPD
eukprot:2223932-Amphidinium_carterae.3